MASPWVGLGRRCPQWMCRWSDINSGPQKCSMLLGYTGKVGWLWHLDLIPACVDVLFLLWPGSSRTIDGVAKIWAFPSCFLFLLKWEESFFARSSTLTVSTRVLYDCCFWNCCQGTLQFRKHRLLQASSGVKNIHSEDASHCNFCTQTVGPLKRNFNRTSQSLFALRFGKGFSVRSCQRNTELLRFGEPVCARATTKDLVWLFQLFSAESLLICRTGWMINDPAYLCSSREVLRRWRWIEKWFLRDR